MTQSTSNVSKFVIHSNYDKEPIDVSDAFGVLKYYESILDNTVRVTASFIDTGNQNSGGKTGSMLEQLGSNLTAGEKVELVMTDDNKLKLSMSNDYSLRIKEIRNIVEDTLKTTFTIDFYSPECILNELVESRVTKRYNGKISDSVKSILQKDCIKTKKNIEIDTTLNNFNFIGNTEKPFYKLVWLAKRSIPEIPNAKGNLAGYLFYEIGDNGRGIIGGYKFKSIDKLFQQKPVRKMIFNNNTSIPLAYDNKILEYSFDSTIDLEKKIHTMGKSEQRVWDLYQNKYDGEKQKEFDYSKQYDIKTIAGLEPLKIASDLEIQDKTTRIYEKPKQIGTVPTGKTPEEQIRNSKTETLEIEDVIRQSTNRYNNLFNIKLSIAIYGDFGLHIGDLIYCDFPEISNSKNTSVSKKKGGLYLIVDLCHYITKNGPIYTRLNLVRESIGRKPF